MDWKNIIEQAQERHGLTQVQLAELAHCTQPHISDLKAGRVTEPRYSLGARLVELASAARRKTTNTRNTTTTQEA
jgi:predicted transcriptional regulator